MHEPFPQERPVMSTIGNRPAKVLHKLTSIHGVSVQCRLVDGTDVWVPLSEICRLFTEEMVKQALLEEMVRQVKIQEGLRQ
jgi:hypothetical protein